MHFGPEDDAGVNPANLVDRNKAAAPVGVTEASIDAYIREKGLLRTDENRAAVRSTLERSAQPQDTFRGDNVALCACIHALLRLDAAGAVVPHGIGGHARTLLESAACRLTPTTQAATEAKAPPQPEKCYSTNNEDFNHDSLWEAMEEIEGNDGLEPGRVVYEANANRRTAGYYFDIDHMFEQMGEHAHDHGGEYADDFPDVAPHKKAELGKLICDWLNANVKVNFYTVSNRKEIAITEAMILEHRAEPTPNPAPDQEPVAK